MRSSLKISSTILTILFISLPGTASIREVPGKYKTIQAAINAAKTNDLILVRPGIYKERIILKPGIVLRSRGDDSKGKQGLKRAQATILDGGGDSEKGPGVIMAKGATLDGFTITKVGNYNEKIWNGHFKTRGEKLKDEQGAVDFGSPAIQIHCNCLVKNCIVHHNGHGGIAISGKKEKNISPLVFQNVVYRNMGGGIGVADGAGPIIKGNHCFENLRAGIGCRNSKPIIIHNVCYGNIRAGIGNREKSKAVIRGNKCYQNRRAGIGSRMVGTSPIIEENDCFDNGMAGIGSRDRATPIIRRNRCYKNNMAGIGCDETGWTIIVGNVCRENRMAGIGIKNKATARIFNNKCIDNKLVAIGVIRGAAAIIKNNELSRKGGVPPIVAIKDKATASLENNRIGGGGVAAVLVQGTAYLAGNEFVGKGKGQGSAVWIWQGSDVSVVGNKFAGYRHAVNATKSKVTILRNTIKGFEKTAILITKPSSDPKVIDNRAFTSDVEAKVVSIDGKMPPAGNNELKLSKKDSGNQ